MTVRPRKGIILAGGNGTRLQPLTISVNKHLLPVYDKPMIYHPLSTLMLANVRDIVLISTADAVPQFERLLGDGHRWGVNIEYRIQNAPRGIAECFTIARDFIGESGVTLILGDNLFHGSGLEDHFSAASAQETGATIFGYEVADPTSFGTVVLENGRPIALEEKAQRVRSKLAVPGLYFYDNMVCDIAAELRPSLRGELEITDVNKVYLERGQLTVRQFGRGTVWLDGGSHQNLFEAGQFVKVLEDRSGMKIAVPEEIAWRRGFISDDEFATLVPETSQTEYDRYLRSLVV